MSGIFNPAIFNNTIFNTGEIGAVEEVIKTGTGGIDPPRKRKIIYKPTGLLERKKKGKEGVEQRVEETRQIHEEIKEEIALSFREERPTIEMTMAEVDQEIGILLRKKLQDDEDDMMMLLTIIANE